MLTRVLTPLILTLFVLGPVVHADIQEGVERLRQQDHRPSIGDMLRELSPLPEENPFYDHGLTEFFLEEVRDNGPGAIADLEYLFPGGTYAPIGRDVVLMGDVIDAYYRSIGQRGRVSWVNLSSDSFYGAEDSTLVRFLKERGFDAAKPGPYPFIMFDATSYSGHSQSTKLISAGYGNFVDRGGNPKDLVRLFNVVSVSGRTLAGLNSHKFLDEITDDTFDRPRRIMAVSGKSLTYAKSGVGELQWTGPFGEIREIDGRLEPSSSEAGSTRKETLLWVLFEIIKLTRTPDFHQRVEEAAQSLGMPSFPKTRVEGPRIEIPRFDVDQAAVELKPVIQGLTVTGDEVEPRQKYFTHNAALLIQWLEQKLPMAQSSDRGEALLMMFTEGVLEARSGGLVTIKDIRRLLALVLAELPNQTPSGVPSDDFLRWFEELYKSDPLLHEIWNARAGYFMSEDPNRRGGPEVRATYLAIAEMLEGRLTFPGLASLMRDGACHGSFDAESHAGENS